MSHKYLFAFENDKNCIVEVKKTEMPKDSLVEEVYFWLMIDKISANCSRLDFVSMQKGHYQVREFKNCILEFTEYTAFFESFNDGIPVSFNKISVEEIDESIKDIVSKFI